MIPNLRSRSRPGITIPTWYHDPELAFEIHDRVVVTSEVDHMKIRLLIYLVWAHKYEWTIFLKSRRVASG
uniref:Uncharacterized protein n=1 Tax=Hyaloperonospora arabidopsidis (strain Emoy2) TaxID=559515 RepID=M4BAA0_HYAAE